MFITDRLLASHQCHSSLLANYAESLRRGEQTKALGQCLLWKVSEVSHDSLFIPTFITRAIIFAMVAWFHHYQANCSHRGTHQRGETTNLLFLIGWNSAEMTWQVCWWLSHLNGKSTVYWPHAGTTTHRMGARWRVNSSGQHRRLNGECLLVWSEGQSQPLKSSESRKSGQIRVQMENRTEWCGPSFTDKKQVISFIFPKCVKITSKLSKAEEPHLFFLSQVCRWGRTGPEVVRKLPHIVRLAKRMSICNVSAPYLHRGKWFVEERCRP